MPDQSTSRSKTIDAAHIQITSPTTPLARGVLLRLKHITGDPKTNIPAIIPVSRATWWKGVRENRYPQPRKIGRATVWRSDDIIEFVERIGRGEVR